MMVEDDGAPGAINLCRDCCNLTQGERNASASSSSGAGEGHTLAYKVQWSQETELRDLREESKHSISKGKKPSVKFEDPVEDAKQDG